MILQGWQPVFYKVKTEMVRFFFLRFYTFITPPNRSIRYFYLYLHFYSGVFVCCVLHICVCVCVCVCVCSGILLGLGSLGSGLGLLDELVDAAGALVRLHLADQC